MARRVRTLLLAAAFAALAGAAAARDYVIVASTDPAYVRGQGLHGGARLNLAPGRTVTLMHASGDVVRIKGAAGGVVLPTRQANQAEADRLAILRVMVAPPVNEVVGGARTRSGICPAPETVKTLDAIVQVHEGGCKSVAAQALQTWIAAREPAEP